MKSIVLKLTFYILLLLLFFIAKKMKKMADIPSILRWVANKIVIVTGLSIHSWEHTWSILSLSVRDNEIDRTVLRQKGKYWNKDSLRNHILLLLNSFILLAKRNFSNMEISPLIFHKTKQKDKATGLIFHVLMHF